MHTLHDSGTQLVINGEQVVLLQPVKPSIDHYAFTQKPSLTVTLRVVTQELATLSHTAGLPLQLLLVATRTTEGRGEGGGEGDERQLTATSGCAPLTC